MHIMHTTASSLVAIAQFFDESEHLWPVPYGNQQKFNIEAVNDYPPTRFEIRFERKFPIAGLYFLTIPVQTLWNLCPVEKLFGMQMAGLCLFYWRTVTFIIINFWLKHRITRKVLLLGVWQALNCLSILRFE